MMKKTTKYLIFILLIIFIGGVSGVFFERILMPRLASIKSLNRFSFFRKANEKITVVENTKEVIVKEDFSVREVSQKVIPSVVGIIAYQEGNEAVITDVRSQMRTGIILTGDGLIVTSLDEAWEEGFSYKVIFPETDKKFVDAKLLGTDSYDGLSFLKIDGSNLPTSPLGSEADLEAGEKLMLIGASNEENQLTFSRGVLQGKDNNFSLLVGGLSFSDKAEGSVVSDVEINEENIGGPLVDFNGTVVGIASRGFMGQNEVNYIVTVDKIKDSLERFLNDNAFHRAKLGLYYVSLNKVNAEVNNFKNKNGALVYSSLGQRGLAVIKNSPADLAGLKLGDVILKVDNEEITQEKPLSELIAKKYPETEVVLDVLRGDQRLQLKVLLTENNL